MFFLQCHSCERGYCRMQQQMDMEAANLFQRYPTQRMSQSALCVVYVVLWFSAHLVATAW